MRRDCWRRPVHGKLLFVSSGQWLTNRSELASASIG
jgi:hypothetical protein